MLEPEFTVTIGTENRRQLNWDKMFASLTDKVCNFDSRSELKRNIESSSHSWVVSKACPDFLVTVGSFNPKPHASMYPNVSKTWRRLPRSDVRLVRPEALLTAHAADDGLLAEACVALGNMCSTKLNLKKL